MWAALQQWRRRPAQDGIIGDVYDGEEYKKHCLFLSNPANVTLVMNTDGLALFKSSTKSLWPIWLCINELPVSERYLSCNEASVGYVSSIIV